MTRGSVRPWASSVVPATTNAMSTTSGRNGVSSGSDCAAATVITPRIPDQASTTPPRQPKPSDTKKSTSPIVRARCSARRSMRRAENRWLTSGSVTRRCIFSSSGRAAAARSASRRSNETSGPMNSIRSTRVSAAAASPIPPPGRR